MYLKLLTGLTVVFLGLTYVVMAEKAPQTVAFNQEASTFHLMNANCEINVLDYSSYIKHT